MATRCKYCGAKLDTDGYCSKPCKAGALVKKLAEAEKAKQAQESSDNSSTENQG